MRAITTTHEAIAIAADDHAVLQNHAIPDGAALANGDVRMDRAIAAHRGACTNSRVRIDHCAVADTRAFTNRDERSDGDIGTQVSTARNRRQRVNPRCGARHRRKERNGTGEREIGIAGAQHRTRRGSTSSLEDDGSRRVVASNFSYFGLARNVMSPGCASCMPATCDVQFTVSSSRQSNRAASSLSFTDYSTASPVFGDFPSLVLCETARLSAHMVTKGTQHKRAAE